ncbi:hypothetical protein [Pseudomonas moraviensis]|uniref:Uncharacterized protein n=1 Tax=Pseudomonas moraviensis TaxID=321662 RepID=A0A7Z0AUC2_9PSED|nr:hypothetical protein [Pseudomonas moraviensis]NYH09067.1 hypothetical protein [Pseudomonas moraviensis]
MWEEFSEQQIKAAREEVDPSLPRLFILEASPDNRVAYSQLEKGFTLVNKESDPRLTRANVRIVVVGGGAGHSVVIDVDGDKISKIVPDEVALTFAGTVAEVFYYLITGEKKLTASEREQYSMESKP